MEREHRHLDGEAQEEGPEDPLLQAEREAQPHQFGNFKRVLAELTGILEIKRQDAQQHQHRAGQRIKEKLNGRVQLARSAPHSDDEVHGHQHQFPEHVEQEEIHRHEYAQHAHLQQQEHAVVFLEAVLYCVPRGKDGDEADHRSQHDQQQADAVDADQILRAQARDPVGALHELKAGHAFVEARNQRQRNKEAGKAGQVSPDLDQFLLARRNEQHDQQSRQRREQHQTE